jgi:hypothetical protein
MIKMLKTDEGYVPEKCCTVTNPATTPGGASEVDDVDLPCFGSDCSTDCEDCIIQRVFDEYAKVTGQAGDTE